MDLAVKVKRFADLHSEVENRQKELKVKREEYRKLSKEISAHLLENDRKRIESADLGLKITVYETNNMRALSMGLVEEVLKDAFSHPNNAHLTKEIMNRIKKKRKEDATKGSRLKTVLS